MDIVEFTGISEQIKVDLDNLTINDLKKVVRYLWYKVKYLREDLEELNYRAVKY